MLSKIQSPMTQKLDNYLRTYRKRSGLTQTEVAFVVGCKSGTRVSRHELFARTPELMNALAYEILYRCPVKELFAGLYEKVEKDTLHRAWILAIKLGQRPPTAVIRWKLAWLQAPP